jgi:hypothetical protein
MDSIDAAKTKSSMLCWIILAVFIGGTLVFMINFYNKTLNEIDKNSLLINNRLSVHDLDKYDSN